ncbi:N-acetylgalactosamine-6-sulfatase [Rhizobium favelukesii]|uniref:N-acetylgalactosamine-6-sulfatase n=1 Tax=Rhizobium favelukesii TaxID=348824 RepID=W6RYQ4_9HYPH|nr:N-acetylgalactosamine-6-sulfatase [Rhizobium favelukesii]
MVRSAAAQAQTAAPSGNKPNILVIFGDDIGIPQISVYTMGLMRYRTPNIDRIAIFSPKTYGSSFRCREGSRTSSKTLISSLIGKAVR